MKFTTADKWFSLYIRLRDIVQDDMVVCITCGRLYHWRKVDCGHFVSRGKPMTRFNEQNCHAQCKGCNCFRVGQQAIHGKMIDKKYGVGTSDKLLALGNIRGQKTHTKLALKEIAKEYRIKAKEIAKQKGIDLK